MRSLIALIFLVPLLGSCLENEEDITVRADGSVRIVVAAEGDRADLADGHPIPTGAPWRAEDPATSAWLAGGARTPKSSERADKLRLAMSAEFASADAMPARHAPADAPYRDAFLDRSATLRVRRIGDRTVYIFERRFGGRFEPGWNGWSRVDAGLSDEVRATFEAERMPTPAQWREVTDLLREAFGDVAEAAIRHACLPVFTDGDGSLAPTAIDAVVARGRTAVAVPLTEARLRAAYAALLAAKHRTGPASQPGTQPGTQQDPSAQPLGEIERDILDAIRTALRTTLTAQELAVPVRNAILAEFELWITASHHTDDLGDEKFTIRITMPGRIVGGHYDALLSENTVVARFEGGDLRGNDRRIRVVSVLE